MVTTALHRRGFLKGAGGVAAAGALGTTLTGPAFSSAAAAAPVDPRFRHGVASGDPLPTGVVLWTRLTPTPDATPGSGKGAATRVRWVVATDAALRQLVRSGTVVTSPTTDHTVKVDVRGLKPDTAYFYGFTAGSSRSPVGRTRTAPAVQARTARLRFGMVSCSNWTGGYFSAYRHLAARDDLDFVVHLGDYLYEYGNTTGRYGPSSLTGTRDHDPATEMLLLSDYRRRHAQYKTDPDLQELHRRYAFITTWDDHEVANDTWRDGAENHTDSTEGDYTARRNRAYQAYAEWMPIRLPHGSTAAETRIYRRLRFGTLADLTMLDLRQYRDQQAPATDGRTIDDPKRTMTGPAQQAFLESGLTASGSPTWRLFGNSVQLMPVKSPPLPMALATALATLQGGPAPASLPQSGFALIVDPWDGYTANRKRVLDVALTKGVGDAVFLTGDIHSTWAADLPLDPGTYTGSPTAASPSAAVEFVCPSITSDNLNEITGTPARTSSVAVEDGIKAQNRHIKEVEFDSHGYSVVEVTPQRVQFDTYFISDREDPAATQRFFRAFQSAKGSRTVTPTSAPIPLTRPDRAAPASRAQAPGPSAVTTATGAAASLPSTGPTATVPVLAGLGLAAAAGLSRLRSRGQAG